MYLWAWLLLAGMIVVAVILYAGAAVEFVTQLVDTPEWELVFLQAPVVLAGAFAGALGASLSALLNMQRRSRREHGYFDRKYGLRGLLLPLLGMFFGLLLAVVAAIVYILAEIDPSVLHLGNSRAGRAGPDRGLWPGVDVRCSILSSLCTE